MRKQAGIVVFVAVLVIGSSAALSAGDILKFDFGRKDRPNVMPGFRGVSVHDVYNAEKGYGWTDVTGEVTVGAWKEERGTLEGCVRRRLADDLSGDFIAGGGKFAVKVPNGRYVVWVMSGDWGEYLFHPRGKYTVLAEGKVIGGLDHSTYAKFRKDFWHHRNDIFLNGADLFEKYVEPRFRIFKAEVEVTDGRLDLQMRVDVDTMQYVKEYAGYSKRYAGAVGPLNALVVYPVGENKAGEEELAKIKAARKAQFDKKYKVVVIREPYIGGLKPEERKRGFALWSEGSYKARDLWEQRARSPKFTLDAMVSLGEMEPITVEVFPVEANPGRFTCTVGELVGNKGDRLPASTVSVRVSKPWEMTCQAPEGLIGKVKDLRPKAWIVTARPYFVVERDWFEGQRKVQRQFWLTVRMPESARSTVYKATVKVTGAGNTAELPLTVSVIPVKLDRAKQAISLHYRPAWYGEWFPDLKAVDWRWQLAEKDMKLMYDYGMTTVGFFGSILPNKPGGENRWEKAIKLYQKIGFERELVQAQTMGLYHKIPKELGSPRNKTWQDAFVKIFRDYQAVADKYGQKVIYSIGDEGTNDGSEAKIIEIGRLTKERMPDLNFMSDINGYRELMGLARYLDAVGFNRGWEGSYGTNRTRQLMTRDVIERVRKLGATPWFINGGKGRYPFGIWLWKTTQWGQYGKIEWHYNASSADPFNPFDGTSRNDFGSLVLPDQVCTIQFEQCREGIDDLRYLQYLEKLVAENADSRDPHLRNVVARAQHALTLYNDLVPDRFDSRATSDGAGVYTGVYWTQERLDGMRREIAMLICMFKGTPIPGVYEDFVIADGDTGPRPGRHISSRIVEHVKDPEHATQGEHCFKFHFKDGKGYGGRWGALTTKDWRGYRTLKLDVVNPQKKNVKLVLNLRDQLAANLGDFDLRHRAKFVCKPGKNTFNIDLVGIKASGCDHVLDLSCLFNFFFTTEEKQDTTLYIDNMRLSPK